jgi:uncharacterized protein YbjT (DUF2867 family)
MRIAVAGGTGMVGSLVVAQLEARDHVPVVLSRSEGVNLMAAPGTADRLTEKLDEVDVVIDVTSTATTSAKAATTFFTTATGNLLRAGAEAGVHHHVLLSIVGIDETPFGYYIGKVAQEKLVAESGVPSTIVRAPQFHEFAQQMVQRATFAGVTLVPKMLSAPMAAREVAAVLVDLAEGPPSGRVPDIGGPRREQMPDLVRRLLRHQGSRRPVIGMRVPGAAGKAMRSGSLIPAAPGIVGFQTYDEWLADLA